MVKIYSGVKLNKDKKHKEKLNFDEVKTVYKRIMTYVFDYKFFFVLGIIGIMLNASLDAGLTWSLKPLLDQGFIARDQQFLTLLPFLVLIAFAIRGFASFIASYSISRISRQIIMVMRQQIFAKLLKLPADYYDKKTSGGLISTLIYNVDQVSNASANSLIILVRETCFIVGLLTVMFIISWQLTFLFFITVPFIAFIAQFSSKRMRRYGRRVQDRMGDVTHIAEESIEGYRVIRTFGGQAYELEKFNQATEDNCRKEMQMILTNAAASPVVQLVISVIIAITIYLATMHVGQVTAGGFASILAAMLAILKPLKNITTINNSIQKGVVGAESIFKLLDESPEQDEGTTTVQRVKGDIKLDNVCFAYASAPDSQVLKQLHCHITPGSTVALVGKSGSGKSTLVHLLPRFYDNYKGDIYIDDLNTRSIALESLRDQFAFVSQNVTLFNDTIFNNIAYGRQHHTDPQRVIHAAKAANAWEFIAELPKGLDTMIGENGLRLSGGQRQRLAIARALLKDAPILILDEATSALDTESERKIQEALPRLIENRTTLVIAHRLSTIENADKIILLEDGRIVEAGNHAELLAKKGAYAKLHALQFNDNQLVDA